MEQKAFERKNVPFHINLSSKRHHFLEFMVNPHLKRLTTGKNEKVHSSHVTAIKFKGMKRGWSKKFQLYYENYDFYENVKFGAISLKIDIL